MITAVRTKTPELQELAAAHDDLTVMDLDTSSVESISSWAAKLAGEVDHVDVIINNAGTTGLDGYTRWEIEDVTEEVGGILHPREAMQLLSSHALSACHPC